LLREPFDVALIDLEMIDADGYSVARTVRGWQADEASRGCRLIAFSAHSRDQRWAGCAEAGFDDYVEKPIDRAVLMASVRARSDRGV
jgi:CheY-like chemotaxis protein